MGRRKGYASIAFSASFLVAFMACGSDEPAPEAADSERQTIRVARTLGGQSGMEGSCLPLPEPRPFSPDEMRALIEGTHETTLAYRAERSLPGSSIAEPVGLPMTVRVELQGEPRIDTPPYEGCAFRIDQDVVVTVSLDEPALDVVIETYASAFSSTFATLQEQLGSDVAEALGLPPSDVITFTLAFNERGMHGTFEHDECGRAVFPTTVRCPDWERFELDLGQRPELPPLLLSTLGELSDIPLDWGDGTQTTLSLSLAEVPQWACRFAFETFCPENLQIPVSVRAVTADGRLDAELPAELSVEVATEASAMDDSCGFGRPAGEIVGLSLFASYFGEAAAGPGVTPPLEADTALSLRVWIVPESPAQTLAEVGIFAFERRSLGLEPPIDATIDPAGASCIAFAPVAEADEP